MIKVNVDADVRERWFGAAVLGIVEIQNLRNEPLPREFEDEVAQSMAKLRGVGEAAVDEPTARRIRATFRAMPDMDPTRYRPASETLTRRLLHKEFPRINPIVDVNNLLSVQLRVPCGAYDGSLIHPYCTYRIGESGENYTTISDARKNAEGKLVLADPKGVIGSPVADSGRALIREETRHVIVIIYFPFETTTDDAHHLCEAVDAKFRHYLGGQVLQRLVLPSEAQT